MRCLFCKKSYKTRCEFFAPCFLRKFALKSEKNTAKIHDLWYDIFEVICVSEEMNHDLLKAVAEEEQGRVKKNEDTYVPRPLFQRVFAWVLAILVIIGVIIFYFNFFKA